MLVRQIIQKLQNRLGPNKRRPRGVLYDSVVDATKQAIREVIARPSPLPHVDSGVECLMYHGDGQSQCIVCRHCGGYIRPSGMSQACFARAPGYRPMRYE